MENALQQKSASRRKRFFESLTGNGLDFHQSASGQVLHGEGSPGRLVVTEELGINTIHGGKISDVCKEAGGFDYIVEG